VASQSSAVGLSRSGSLQPKGAYLVSSAVKNRERPGLMGLSDGFEVFDFAGLSGAAGDYLAI